ncbi:MAG: Deazaflavin-dependent nitroreductase [Pseudomonadales bacterium]|nr:Deazaflavin-dependent nitroreductase [Pseudomonadales bacterium]
MSQPAEVKRFTAGQEKFGTWFIRNIGSLQVLVYELSGGRLWNTFLGGQVAILTTTGRKSGKRRKVPLLYIEDGERVVMAASKGGMSVAPVWFRNIESNPRVRIQIGNRARDMQARIASEAEERTYWPRLEAMYPGFAEYRARCEGVRHIPVVVFEPLG